MTKQSNLTRNKPTHRLYIITGDGSWQEIGAAWANKDGRGYSLIGEGLTSRIVMRAITERTAKAAA